MAKRKRTNNDLQNITHKTKDRVTRNPLEWGSVIELVVLGADCCICVV